MRAFRIKARSSRPDWSAIWEAERDQIDLAAVATRLLGPPPGRRGERGRRLWWQCPLHDDYNPSFCIRPGEQRWKCWGCAEHGDAVALLRKVKGLTFGQAVAELTGHDFSPSPVNRPAPREAPTKPTRLSHEEAVAMVEDAELRLWTPEGADGLGYLRGRGLIDETIRASRLGWIPAGQPVPWKAPGLVIPWFGGASLSLVKYRPSDAWRESLPSDRRPPKYLECFKSPDHPPLLYPGPETARRGAPVIVVEGELDALLLAQELGEWAAVVTLGAATMGKIGDGINPAVLGHLYRAPVWHIATDADDAGDRAAESWKAYSWTRRFRPPHGAKDWTDLHAGGWNRIRYYWLSRLGLAPSWEELEAQRWGPCEDGDWGPPDYAEQERLSIREADGIVS